MNQTTRYNYEKRIKELQHENARLSDERYIYKAAVTEIYDGVLSCVKSNTSICKGWILERTKKCFK